MTPVPLVNIGDLGMYSGGQFVPDGDYIMVFNTLLFAGHTPKPSQKARLGVQVDFYPRADAREESKLQQFYSFGSKADQSFMPAPNGKGIVPVAGAAGGTLNDKTNWFMLYKSMLDSGLPPGIFVNDFSVLDGMHAHISNVDEPEERKSFATNATSEVQPQQGPRQTQKIAIVTEIFDDGKPWEGTGGLPEEAPAPPVPNPVVAKPAAKAPAKRTAPATPAAGTDTEAIHTAAIEGVSAVLDKKPNGCPRMLLRTETFKKCGGADNPMAAQVISQFFDNETNLSQLLGELGYTLMGAQVKPA